MLNTLLACAALSLNSFAPPKKIAIYPLSFADGTETAVKTAKATLNRVFSDQFLEPISEEAAREAWIKTIELPVGRELHTSSKLLRFGRAVKADYVCSAALKWRTRTIWVGVGPKTKADCVIDLRLIDVKAGTIMLDAKNIKADSNEVDTNLEAAGSVLLFPAKAFSGGPKTPQQERAAQLAIAKSLDPWLAFIEGKRKLQTKSIR